MAVVIQIEGCSYVSLFLGKDYNLAVQIEWRQDVGKTDLYQPRSGR